MNVHDMSCMSRGGTGGGAGALIALGTVGPSLLIHFFGNHYYLTRNGVIVGSILLLGPLGFFKSMRRFAVPSMVAVWMVLALCFCIIVKAIVVYAGDGPHPIAPAGSFSFAQASFFPALGGTCNVMGHKRSCSMSHHLQQHVHESVVCLLLFTGISYIFTCHDMSIHVIHSLQSTHALFLFVCVCVSLVMIRASVSFSALFWCRLWSFFLFITSCRSRVPLSHWQTPHLRDGRKWLGVP
jgi:hypothetical protein